MIKDETGYEYWSRFADTFDDDSLHIIGEETQKELKNWLERQFKPDDHVLELACGNGFCTRWIAPLVRHVTATDMSDAMLERARERLAEFDNIKIRKENCCRLSFDSETFDSALIANTIHVLHEPLIALDEIRRVLKPGGILLITSYTSFGLTPDEKKAMMRRYFKTWGPVPEHSFQATPENISDLARKSGFEIEEAILIGSGSKCVCVRARKK